MHRTPPTKMSTPPPPRSVSLSQTDLSALVNSSVSAGLSAFTQAQAQAPPPAGASGGGIVAGIDSVDLVGLKLSTFWTDRPTTWFRQAEAQFRLRKITVEETMFNHVLVALDNRTSGEVEHVIDNPDPKAPYTALKSALLEAYEKTDLQKDREYNSIRSLGELTPSAMLRKMRRLRPVEEHSSQLFRFGFFRVLPIEVSNILVALEEESLDVLAKKADKILDQRVDAPGSVAAISPVSPDLFTRGEVDALKQLVRPSRAPTPRSENSICRFHTRWGPKAFRCQPGCLFAGTPLAKPQGNGPAGR